MSNVLHDIKKAKESIAELIEVVDTGTDTLERFGMISKRAASIALGGALGVVVSITSPAKDLVSQQNGGLLTFFMGIMGAATGALVINEGSEEKARRIESAARRLGDNPSLSGYNQNLLELHTAITRSVAAKEVASLPNGALQQFLMPSLTSSEISPNASLPLHQTPQFRQSPPVSALDSLPPPDELRGSS